VIHRLRSTALWVLAFLFVAPAVVPNPSASSRLEPESGYWSGPVRSEPARQSQQQQPPAQGQQPQQAPQVPQPPQGAQPGQVPPPRQLLQGLPSGLNFIDIWDGL
jgi:hypothetical protein